MRLTRRQLRRLIEATVVLDDTEKEEIKQAKKAVYDTIASKNKDKGIDPEDVEKADKESDDEELAEAIRYLLNRTYLTESWSGANEQELPDVSEKKEKRKSKKRKSKKAKNWYLGSYYFRDDEDFDNFNDFDDSGE